MQCKRRDYEMKGNVLRGFVICVLGVLSFTTMAMTPAECANAYGERLKKCYQNYKDNPTKCKECTDAAVAWYNKGCPDNE